MKQAIEKLKQLAEDNANFINQIESGEVKAVEDMEPSRVRQMIRTYKYWSQCLYMAAWLLEQEIESGEEV